MRPVQFGHRVRVAVVDNFSKPVVDINGDGVKDISHGELVERIIESRHPGTRFERFALPAPDSEALKMDRQQLTRHLATIADRQEQDGPYDAINLSMAAIQSFSSISQVLHRPVDAETLPGWRQAIVDAFRVHPKPKARLLAEIVDWLTLLATQRENIYLSAGNAGPGHFNVMGLADGVTTVGSVDAQGKPVASSCQNRLVNRTARGEFAVRSVPGGFSLGEGDHADISNALVGESPWQRLVGRRASSVCATADDVTRFFADCRQRGTFEALSDWQDRLFPIGALVAAAQADPDGPIDAESLAALPKDAYLQLSAEGLRVFVQDAQGIIRHRSAPGMPPDCVSQFSGTSFATALTVGDDLRRACPDARSD